MFSMLRSKNKQFVNEFSLPSVNEHFIYKSPLKGPFPKGTMKVMFGMGCFWGVERIFWKTPGVVMTAAGYSGGTLVNPTYQDVCSSNTGHNEVVLVHYNPNLISIESLLRIFWEGHNPTQGMRQGNDVGTQYRSGIYTFSTVDLKLAMKTKLSYSDALQASGFSEITTEILNANEFYYAEEYHQQYLGKNPNGYCGVGGTGVCL